jgi:hypothetical protein
MTTSKGPWSYDAESGMVTTRDTTGDWTANSGPKGITVVCTVESLDGISNGDLIAAAPEMRDALRSLLDWLMDDDRKESDAVAIYDAARAALAKAER